jgi:hypothetical protein
VVTLSSLIGPRNRLVCFGLFLDQQDPNGSSRRRLPDRCPVEILLEVRRCIAKVDAASVDETPAQPTDDDGFIHVVVVVSDALASRRRFVSSELEEQLNQRDTYLGEARCKLQATNPYFNGVARTRLLCRL